jgi:hypothetical protein
MDASLPPHSLLSPSSSRSRPAPAPGRRVPTGLAGAVQRRSFEEGRCPLRTPEYRQHKRVPRCRLVRPNPRPSNYSAPSLRDRDASCARFIPPPLTASRTVLACTASLTSLPLSSAASPSFSACSRSLGTPRTSWLLNRCPISFRAASTLGKTCAPSIYPRRLPCRLGRCHPRRRPRPRPHRLRPRSCRPHKSSPQGSSQKTAMRSLTCVRNHRDCAWTDVPAAHSANFRGAPRMVRVTRSPQASGVRLSPGA